MGRSPTAIVLAAGTSSRMGTNKLLLPRPDRPLLRTVCERVLAAGFEQVIVVLGHQHDRTGPLLADLPLDTIVNPDYRTGLATSVGAGVRAAGSSTPGYLFALADMPEIRAETYGSLRRAFEREGAEAIVAPYHAGRRGNPVVFARRYRDELLSLHGDRGAQPLLDVHASRVVKISVDDPGVLFDIDEPNHL